MAKSGFANVFQLKRAVVDAKRQRFQDTKSSLSQTSRSLESTIASLDRDPNWIEQNCTRPPMQPIPPAPEMPFTENEMNFQVNGFCMELMTVRYNKYDVRQMLSSGMMGDLVDVHKTWQAAGGVSQTPPCARQLRSRLEDGLYNLLGNIGEALLGPMGRASAMEQALGSCANDAIAACRAPLTNWEQRVAAIRAAPENAYRACQSKRLEIASLTKDKARLETQLEQTRVDYETEQAAYAALPDRLPLSQARCP